jgi:aminopeptidase N
MKLFARPALILSIGMVCSAAYAADRANTASLSQQDAAERAARVSDVDYQLDFTLTGAESFTGKSTIGFRLKDRKEALTVDLADAAITALTVNGKAVTPQYNQWFITIPPAQLRAGRNTVAVSYERKYNSNGEGLHRMVDAADKRVYIYSQFGPAAAQQAFAAFDQPDIKANFRFTVTAPGDWEVVSTAPQSSVEKVNGGKRWRFPATHKLSTYTVSLHAGPYKKWEDHSGKYPVRLFARQSVAAKVLPEEWFKTTRQGLAWFDNYYGIPYPFGKYDQLLVPNHRFGAMENTAAVTFAEANYLREGAWTDEQRHSLAAVILHEMAHQWFGDMVTMKWWNGVWLNESFASFMGTLATAEGTDFRNGWQRFYASDKSRAYVQDTQVQPHAVDTPVASNAGAYDNLDAITYNKGASTLVQLRHLLGDEVFRQGVHNYLAKFAWKNATLDDFIGTLGATAKRDLKPWAEQWLRQPGVNTVTADYRCDGGKVSSFVLLQGGDVLREQRVQVAFMRMRGKALGLDRAIAVTYKGASTSVPALVGAPCPDLVYPNYKDWGYVKVQLDARSLATANANLQNVADPFTRTMLWDSLWDGVRDGTAPLDGFIDTILNNAVAEKDAALQSHILKKATLSLEYLERMPAKAAYARKAAKALEVLAAKGFLAHKGNTDLQWKWIHFFLSTASSPDALDQLKGMLEGRDAFGINVDQNIRLMILRRLNEYDHPGSLVLLEAELARRLDESDKMVLRAIRASRPDAAIKAARLAEILAPEARENDVRLIMHGLYPPSQGALSELTASERLEQLPALEQAPKRQLRRTYLATMLPKNCSSHSVARLAAAAENGKALSTATQRALMVAQQDDARCVAIERAF